MRKKTLRIPKIKTPKFKAPKIKVPKFKAPKVTTLKFVMPKITKNGRLRKGYLRGLPKF
jgi:hypothetical protein